MKNEKPWERTEQKCSHCEIVKPIAEFYDNLCWESGKMAQCRACHRSYTRAWKRGYRAAQKKAKSSG